MGITQLETGETNPPAKTVPSKTESSERPEQLPLDTVFKLLSNRRRRYVIAYLNRNDDGQIRVRDLTDQIAAWENDVPIQEVTYKERKRVYTSLYQSHLVKMDRLGIVRYDQSRGTVERLRAIDQLETYLDSTDDDADEEPRSYVSVGVAALCVAFVIATWGGFLPFLSQTGFGIAFVVASIFLIDTGAHAAGFHDSVR